MVGEGGNPTLTVTLRNPTVNRRKDEIATTGTTTLLSERLPFVFNAILSSLNPYVPMVGIKKADSFLALHARINGARARPLRLVNLCSPTLGEVDLQLPPALRVPCAFTPAQDMLYSLSYNCNISWAAVPPRSRPKSSRMLLVMLPVRIAADSSKLCFRSCRSVWKPSADAMA